MQSPGVESVFGLAQVLALWMNYDAPEGPDRLRTRYSIVRAHDRRKHTYSDWGYMQNRVSSAGKVPQWCYQRHEHMGNPRWDEDVFSFVRDGVVLYQFASVIVFRILKGRRDAQCNGQCVS